MKRAEVRFFKTYLPIRVFFLIIASIWMLILSISNIVWMLYMPNFLIIYYVLLCRYSCYVKCSSEIMQICYFAPWQKNISITFDEVKYIDYERSGYNMFADKRIGAKLFLPQYCYDRLIVFKSSELKKIEYVNINTIIFGFNRIVGHLKAINKLK